MYVIVYVVEDIVWECDKMSLTKHMSKHACECECECLLGYE